MPGDILARGARSATFGPAKNISQEKWNAIWETAEKADSVIQITSEKNETLDGKSSLSKSD